MLSKKAEQAEQMFVTSITKIKGNECDKKINYLL